MAGVLPRASAGTRPGPPQRSRSLRVRLAIGCRRRQRSGRRDVRRRLRHSDPGHAHTRRWRQPRPHRAQRHQPEQVRHRRGEVRLAEARRQPEHVRAGAVSRRHGGRERARQSADAARGLHGRPADGPAARLRRGPAPVRSVTPWLDGHRDAGSDDDDRHDDGHPGAPGRERHRAHGGDAAEPDRGARSALAQLRHRPHRLPHHRPAEGAVGHVAHLVPDRLPQLATTRSVQPVRRAARREHGEGARADREARLELLRLRALRQHRYGQQPAHARQRRWRAARPVRGVAGGAGNRRGVAERTTAPLRRRRVAPDRPVRRLRRGGAA